MYRRTICLFAALTVLTVAIDAATVRSHGYTFSAHVTGPSGRRLSEQYHHERKTLYVHEGDE